MTIREILALATVIAIFTGWYFDHSRLVKLTSRQGLSDFSYGDICATIRFAKFSKGKPDSVYSLLESNLATSIVSAWQWRENIDFGYGVGTSYEIVRDIAEINECKSPEDVVERVRLAFATDDGAGLKAELPELFDPSSLEYSRFREFIRAAMQTVNSRSPR